MAFGTQKKGIGDMLIEEGLLREEQFMLGLAYGREHHVKVAEALIQLGFVTEDDIAGTLSRQLGIEFVDLQDYKPDGAVLKLVNASLLRKYVMVPIAFKDGKSDVVRLAMADPMNMNALDDFCIITDLMVEPLISTPREIMNLLDRYFGESEPPHGDTRYARAQEPTPEDEISASAVQTAEDEIPASFSVVQLVKAMIESAARQRASDIHVEALENVARVRFRIDGALYEKYTYDIQRLPAIIAEIKTIGGMDIEEKMKPQDGRIAMEVEGTGYDIRISTLPTVYGENCVMELAQKKMRIRDKSELGFSPEDLAVFDDMLKKPNGLLLVAGPAGNGKSTTLYAILRELNKGDVSIITVEDPVEAPIDGISQVQVNGKAGLTFASALRSVLRQDPDIIMIGEIKDKDTAEIAVEASGTGDLVVGALHTGSAAGAISRLMDMGIESCQLADAVIGVIAQRLVRRLCDNCKSAVEASAEEKKVLQVNGEAPMRICKPCGCPQCNNTGYSGRIGIYEMMKATPELKRIIARGGNAKEMNLSALRSGMSTLPMAAANLVRQGVISMNEFYHVSRMDVG